MPISKIKTSSILADAASTNLNIDAGTLFLDTTNNFVGIGTTTPSNRLTVVAPVNTNSYAQIYASGTGNSYLGLTALGGTTNELSTNTAGDFVITSAGIASDVFKMVHTGAVTSTMVLNSGNVGIGTASPATRLDVYTTTASTTTGVLKLYGANGADRYTGIDFHGVTSETYNKIAQITALVTNGGNGTGNPIGGDLIFRTNNSASNVPTEKMRIVADGTVGIGTASPSTYGAKLAIYSAASSTANIQITNPGIGTGTIGLTAASSNFKIYNSYASGTLASGAGIDIDTSGNVGIGTASTGGYALAIQRTSDNALLKLTAVTTGGAGIDLINSGGAEVSYIGTGASGQALTFRAGSTTERMRIDSSGNVGIAQTDPTNNGISGYNTLVIGNSASTAAGITLRTINTGTPTAGIIWARGTGGANGFLKYDQSTDSMQFGASGTEKMRIDNNGNIIFTGMGATIGAGTTPSFWRTYGGVGCGIHLSDNAILPTNKTGGISDNTVIWGSGTYRWSIIYAATGTINTSDRELKQDIADLSVAELAVAKEIKSLFKTFRWKDAVAQKGDDARIHVGVIAQDVYDAFANNGLDASHYALWCSDTWYEVDGTGVDSVTGMKYTAESEGAVERTRLGVRYDQLLAFVIAAL